MPDSAEVYTTTPQINIPPTFPFILKQYAKAAIRTQPYDLLRWSAAYFRALAKGEEPPIKDRLEYPPPDTPSGLSPGYLKVLIKQIGKGGVITLDELLERWNGVCLAEEPLHEMLAVGQFGHRFEWLHFVAVAAGFLSHNLTQTMVLLCNLLTDEPDGGSAMIPLQTFTTLYTFLASLDCGGPDDHDENEGQHEYIMAEGQKDDNSSLYSEDSASLKRETVESCPTDPSIYEANLRSFSAHQIFAETHSPYPSPPSSRTCTSYADIAIDSNATLTPDNQCSYSQIQENKHSYLESGETYLVTYFDAKMKESPISSQGFVTDRENTETPVHAPDSSGISPVVNTEKKSVSFIKQGTAEEPKVTSSVSAPNTALIMSQNKGVPPNVGNGRGDVDEKVASLEPTSLEHTGRDLRSSDRSALHKLHVPGIGAVVDAIQIQAVIDYLEGVGLKQEGMVKPSNIRHFLCPPLEKVPASQKTRV